MKNHTTVLPPTYDEENPTVMPLPILDSLSATALPETHLPSIPPPLTKTPPHNSEIHCHGIRFFHKSYGAAIISVAVPCDDNTNSSQCNNHIQAVLWWPVTAVSTAILVIFPLWYVTGDWGGGDTRLMIPNRPPTLNLAPIPIPIPPLLDVGVGKFGGKV